MAGSELSLPRPRLTSLQRALLAELGDACHGDDCEGGCNAGWVEPLGGGRLRSALALDRKGLASVANGRHRHWTAAHVTNAGRALLPAKVRATMSIKALSFSVEGDAAFVGSAMRLLGSLAR